MLRITRDKNITLMAGSNEPAARAKPGETVVFETIDALGGQVKTGNEKVDELDWNLVNPAAGPLYIEGAEPGDCLKVEILEIKPAGISVMATGSGFDSMEGSEPKVFVFPVRDGFVVVDDKVKLPLNSMIGVIGTAPAGEGIPTKTPGDHGGNMDCNLITAGMTLYLPVNVPGALLALGDLHGVMGDGEVAGCGAEMGGEVIVKVDVIKDLNAPLPMLRTKDNIVTLASALTLDEAAKKATANMHRFLTDAGMEGYKASVLLSLTGNLRICQIVDPLMTARMEFPMDIINKYGLKVRL